METSRLLLTRDFMVRIIGGGGRITRLCNLRMPTLADLFHTWLLGRLAVVDVVFGFKRIDLRHERPIVLERSPIWGLVNGSFIHTIKVKLRGADFPIADVRDVGGGIVSVGGPMDERSDFGGQTKVVVVMGSHVSAKTSLAGTDESYSQALLSWFDPKCRVVVSETPGNFQLANSGNTFHPLDDFHFLSHCLDYAKNNMYLAEVRTDELHGAIHFVEGLDVNT